ALQMWYTIRDSTTSQGEQKPAVLGAESNHA
ncbi:MAG: hypothetical protein RUDDFDWM_002114, partial [Candidatus Fervidibacterota bacterium]